MHTIFYNVWTRTFVKIAYTHSKSQGMNTQEQMDACLSFADTNTDLGQLLCDRTVFPTVRDPLILHELHVVNSTWPVELLN